jgi:hypothetical protein
VVSKETAIERLFLMKDLAAVEEAVGLGAKNCTEININILMAPRSLLIMAGFFWE